jgi:thioredoxin-like negative regulator of GroEL
MLGHATEPQENCEKPKRHIYQVRLLRAFGTTANLRLVLTNEPGNHKAKLRLAEVYEAQNEPKKALALVYEGTH